MTGPESSGPETGERAAPGAHGSHHVELVGPHLRVSGHLSLGRFPRLADLVNHNRGFIVLHDARLLDGDGAPTGLSLAELVVNQDEVTFIGHAEGAGVAPSHPGSASRFVIYTPGHTISGSIHRYRDISLVNFVEAHDPRFLDVADAAARAHVDPRVAIRYECMLVNRTHINAIAELPEGGPDPALDQPPAGAAHDRPGAGARARA